MEPISPGLVVLLYWILRAWLKHRSDGENTSAPGRVGNGPACPKCGIPYNPADYLPNVTSYCSHCKAELVHDVAPSAPIPIDDVSGPMTDEEVQVFSTKYYLSPSPERIPEVLAHSLQFWWVVDVDKSAMWYFFARIAQDHPFLVREYEELFRRMPSGRS